MASAPKAPCSVAFLHPDLGLGGAERLVVDAAVELVAAGHKVDMYTAYHDPKRCFEETRGGSGGFGVIVAGDWFPRQLAGRFLALCAYIRCILVALYIAWLGLFHKVHYDVVIVDQVAVVIPFLKYLTCSKVLFYCHFPDMLLAQRRSLIKRLYRLHKRGILPDVLHPAVPVPTDEELQRVSEGWRSTLSADLVSFIGDGPMLLSINRFERKKGIDLAIRALHEFMQRTPGAPVKMVLAGGYDARLFENVQHLQELKDLVAELGLQDHVRFVTSFSDSQRAALLTACTAVVYTPQFEHFGIVPLEAMAAKKPVVAVSNGGPVETVAHEQVGLLCDPTPAAFAAAFQRLLCHSLSSSSSGALDPLQLGEAAKSRVQALFSRAAFGRKLQAHLTAVTASR